ncbi:hypothetical protein EVAR_44200_1 [Eumeta japonica]|uniref:HTH psq-type domain-containing protein n=1 Tax=Eumeta variegata TaxID=151549 RepID=A0A4C1W294_EUMVA|nr:hypothetical protein EVAR_44200_1 [Eumeta japonica]
MIFNVYNYFKQEATEGVKNVKQVQQRTADATGISIRTVRNILVEEKQCHLVPILLTPEKKTPTKLPVTDIENHSEELNIKEEYIEIEVEPQCPTTNHLQQEELIIEIKKEEEEEEEENLP